MRWIQGLLAAILGGNGTVMMLVPAWWYPRVPGVIETGPYNDHFIRDIGAAFLACALALAWSAWGRRQDLGLAATAATFLALHAVIHLVTPFCGTSPPWPLLARDFPGVFLPALLGLAFVAAKLRAPEGRA